MRFFHEIDAEDLTMGIFICPLCVVMSNWCKSELKRMCLGNSSWSACPPASLSFQSTWKCLCSWRWFLWLLRLAEMSMQQLGLNRNRGTGKSYKVLYKVISSCHLFHSITVKYIFLVILSYYLKNNRTISFLFSIIIYS